MSAYFTKLLPLLQLTSYLYLIDRADAKFGIHGVEGVSIGLRDVPPSPSPSRLHSRRTRTRKKAVAVGTPPQLHYDPITIISNCRGGGSGSGIEENPDYDDDRKGTNADAAGEDFTIRNDNDVDSSDETEDNDNSDSGEDDGPSLLFKPKFNPKRGHSTARIRSRHAAHWFCSDCSNGGISS